MSGENAAAFALGDDVPSDAELRQSETEGVTEQPSAPVAEPADDAADDTLIEASDGDDAEPTEKRRVPLPELLKERERRKQAEARAEERERALEAGNKRLQQLIEAMQQRAAPQPEPQAPALPPLETDPVNHFDRRIGQTEAQVAEMAARQQQEAQRAQFVSAYNAAARQFATQQPDFQQAYQHALAELASDAALFGADPTAIETQIVQTAFQQGRNPAQAMYEFAKRRGYGATPAPAAAEARVDAIARGTQQARSVAAAPGKPATQSLSLQALADMPEEDFAEFYNGLSGKKAQQFHRSLRTLG